MANEFLFLQCARNADIMSIERITLTTKVASLKYAFRETITRISLNVFKFAFEEIAVPRAFHRRSERINENCNVLIATQAYKS